MKALVLGGHGAVGASVARLADQLGIETFVGIRSDRGRARLEEHPDVRREPVDVTDPGSVERAVRSVRPDWIVMAAFPREKLARDPAARRRLLDGATGGVLGVLEGCAAAGFDGLLTWVGGAAAYGEVASPRDPSGPLRPRGWRGAVKAAETLLAAPLAGRLGLRFVEIRVFTAYGPYEQADRLLPSLLRAGLTGSRVRLTPEPTWRDWIHYEDVAAACVASLSADATTPRVWNACSGTKADNHTIARRVEALVGGPLVASEPWLGEDTYGEGAEGLLPRPADGLDWSPRLDLDEGLRRTWEWARTPRGRAWLLQETPG